MTLRGWQEPAPAPEVVLSGWVSSLLPGSAPGLNPGGEEAGMEPAFLGLFLTQAVGNCLLLLEQVDLCHLTSK